MKLSEYLSSFEEELSNARLIEKSGIGKATFYKLKNGRDIRLSMAMKIEEATNYKVTCRDIYEEFVKKSHKK